MHSLSRGSLEARTCTQKTLLHRTMSWYSFFHWLAGCPNGCATAEEEIASISSHSHRSTPVTPCQHPNFTGLSYFTLLHSYCKIQMSAVKGGGFFADFSLLFLSMRVTGQPMSVLDPCLQHDIWLTWLLAQPCLYWRLWVFVNSNRRNTEKWFHVKCTSLRKITTQWTVAPRSKLLHKASL